MQHFYFLCFYLCDFKIVTDGRPATAAGDCGSTLPCLWRRCFKFQQQCFAETHISSTYRGADALIIDIQWYALAAHVMFSLLCVQNSFFNLTVLSSDIIIILNSTLLFVNVYREEILTFYISSEAFTLTGVIFILKSLELFTFLLIRPFSRRLHARAIRSVLRPRDLQAVEAI